MKSGQDQEPEPDQEPEQDQAPEDETKRKFREALASLQRGHDLGFRRPRWPYPTGKLLQEYRRLANLERAARHGP